MDEDVTTRVADGLPEYDPTGAADLVPADGLVLLGGIGAAPKLVPQALANGDRDLSLTVLSSADAGFIADTQLIRSGAVDRRYPFAVWPNLRDRANAGDLAFVEDHFSDVERTVRQRTFGDPDVAVVEGVAVGEGWFVPTTAVGAVQAFVEAADRVIVEVNEKVPLSVQGLHDVYDPGLPPHDPIPLSNAGDRIGERVVRFDPDKLAGVVRTEQPPMPYPFREPSEAETAIAHRVAGFLSEELPDNPALADSVTLEVGVGTLGNEIMGHLDRVDFGDREVTYYGEVIQDGLLDLIDDGVFEAASATGLVLSRAAQERLYEDADRYAEHVVTRPVGVSNNPELIHRLGVVAVNNALEVDLYGNANSSHLRGSALQQGIGGSGDFARASLLSIVVLPSTAKDGEVSRVVPMVPHVDHPDHDVDVVVTEQGVADLRGLSPRERAETMIAECAHPDFRDDLRAYLERAEESGGHLPHDLDTCFDVHCE